MGAGSRGAETKVTILGRVPNGRKESKALGSLLLCRMLRFQSSVSLDGPSRATELVLWPLQ